MDDYIEREPLLKRSKKSAAKTAPVDTATSSATVGAMQQARLN